MLIIIQIKYQKYTEELYRKDLHDPDNHDGVITQSQTSWNVKSSGPYEASLRTKMDAALHMSANLENSAVATGQSQKKAMPKNAQTTVQLHSSHTLVK